MNVEIQQVAVGELVIQLVAGITTPHRHALYRQDPAPHRRHVAGIHNIIIATRHGAGIIQTRQDAKLLVVNGIIITAVK